MIFRNFTVLALVALAFLKPIPAHAAESTNEFLDFVRNQAVALRMRDRGLEYAPRSLEDWEQRRQFVRTNLLRAWGGFPELAEMQVRKLGEFSRPGYRVEKILLQSFSNVWMTANAYVPDKPGRLPALLMVHGHWRGAKQDPTVQARCIGAARLGFFVLVVDAFGAGERGVGRALGEYHGDMTAAALLPVGLPLSGVQVRENMRAVEYLRARPEVDPERIGITGASGGGNQSMYAGAWDERLKAVAPVCSVGNYQAYLGAACCMCEVVPGALRFCEEADVLGLVAPRALLVINATRDAHQFSVEEASISLHRARQAFALYKSTNHLRHAVFESGHDYSKPMRETVYGWMTLHLKGEGNGSPIPEGGIQPEDPETLRCFPGDSRPADWVTLPQFAAREGRRLLTEKKAPETAEAWKTEKARLRKILADDLLGGVRPPALLRVSIKKSESEPNREISFTPERGIKLLARQRIGRENGGLLIALDLEGGDKAAAGPVARIAAENGWSVVTLDLRATGELAWQSDKVGRAPDHTTAEWALWIGRPLAGQWLTDLRGLLDTLEKADGKLPKQIVVSGSGPAGILALMAAAVDERITGVLATQTLGTFVTDAPYENQRLGILVPGILRDFGDVCDLAALVAPRHAAILGAVRGEGPSMELNNVRQSFERTAKIYKLLDAENHLQLAGDAAEERLRPFFAERPQQGK